MRHTVRRSLALLGQAGLGCIGLAGAAFATDTCRGEMSGTPLRPLPAPAVIGVDLTDNSAENKSLADAFTRGMSNAGAKVPGTQAANVALRLSWQVLSPGGGSGQDNGGNPLVPLQPGPPGTGASVWSGNSQTFLQGGIDRSLPNMPDQHVFLPGQPLQAGLLVFRAEARDPASGTIYWIGAVQCTLQGGGENEALLYQLGQVIGGAVGQRRERVAM